MVKKRTILYVAALIVIGFLLFYLFDIKFATYAQTWSFTDPENLAEYLRSFGPKTVIISILLMILQTLFTPLPLFLLAGANGFIFGLGYGILITLSGSIIGASIAFYLARGFGRGLVYRYLKEAYMAKVDKMSRHEGPWMVFMARLIPVIPSSVISYVAGLSKMTFRGFFIATAVGKLPEIIIYTLLGHSFSQVEGMATKVTILLILLTILFWPIITKKLKGSHGDCDIPTKK
ncbi:TVP38/TMEM64 family protein [Desulforamulus ruminis]|uniref:TVP38/TMEM64 family protein n=1 Tax=Desulforamulus ruminis TaxID=1564 RepID=UPI002357CD11|nr:TVP38/TMEM64 family protein [Desulforamulus ruminis]